MFTNYQRSVNGELAMMSMAQEVASTEIRALKITMAHGTTTESIAIAAPQAPTRLHIPEPATYGGERVAKELNNFIYDFEQYFRAALVPNDRKVQVCAAYLIGDAKVMVKDFYCSQVGRRAI